MSFRPFQPFRGFGGGAAQSIAERYRAAVMADTPVAYWRLGETSGTLAADETGVHSVAYPAAGVTKGQSGPVEGDSSIHLTSAWLLSTSDVFRLRAAYSYEIWIKKDQVPSDALITQPIWNADILAQLSWDHTNPVYLGSFQHNDGAWKPTSMGGSEANQWHHVVATYDGATIKVYRGGLLRNQTAAGLPQDTSPSLYLNRSGYAAPFNMAHFAVYASALSASRVAAHYAAAGY